MPIAGNIDFFDTSAIAKYYHAELGTERVLKIFAEPDRKIAISSLGFVEIQAAFAVKVRSGALKQSGAGMQRARLMLDVAAGTLRFTVLRSVISRWLSF